MHMWVWRDHLVTGVTLQLQHSALLSMLLICCCSPVESAGRSTDWYSISAFAHYSSLPPWRWRDKLIRFFSSTVKRRYFLCKNVVACWISDCFMRCGELFSDRKNHCLSEEVRSFASSNIPSRAYYKVATAHGRCQGVSGLVSSCIVRSEDAGDLIICIRPLNITLLVEKRRLHHRIRKFL